MLKENPAIPLTLTAYKKGMVSNEPLSMAEDANARAIYAEVIDYLVNASERLESLRVSKQDSNAISYGLQHINAVITATDWQNFFRLRCAPQAKPDLQVLARKMQMLMENSEPKELWPGEWHLPFVLESEQLMTRTDKMAISAARCARVSYNAFGEQKPSSLANDLSLAKSLAEDGHFSPFEHSATPLPLPDLRCENFKGFISQRALKFGSQQDAGAQPVTPQAAAGLLESYLLAPAI